MPGVSAIKPCVEWAGFLAFNGCAIMACMASGTRGPPAPLMTPDCLHFHEWPVQFL